MKFAARELKPYYEPVEYQDLEVGIEYFIVRFVDDDMLIPTIESLIYIGEDLLEEDEGSCYFQDIESYLDGISFPNDERVNEAVVHRQPKNELSSICSFESSLNELLKCSLRRAEHGKTS